VINLPTQTSDIMWLSDNIQIISAPLWQQAIKWVLTKLTPKTNLGMRFIVFDDCSGCFRFDDNISFNNLEEGVLKAITLL
jgi:hypothetical protein